jgi:hypothetical protein
MDRNGALRSPYLTLHVALYRQRFHFGVTPNKFERHLSRQYVGYRSSRLRMTNFLENLRNYYSGASTSHSPKVLPMILATGI